MTETAGELTEAADLLGARLVLADLAVLERSGAGRPDRHDPLLLAGALARIFEGE